MTDYAEGGIVRGPRFQREHVAPPEATVDERIREARILGFSAGVVLGVAWMLVVAAVAVHWS